MTVVSQVQWGDVATRVASLGTVAAVAVALFQVYRERQARLLREAADRKDRHQAQARLVSAWVGYAVENPNETDEQRHWYRGWQTPVFLRNSSQEPAYEVVVCIVNIQGAGPGSMESMLSSQHRRTQESNDTGDYVFP